MHRFLRKLWSACREIGGHGGYAAASRFNAVNQVSLNAQQAAFRRAIYVTLKQAQIDESATFNGTPFLVAATLFVALTIPLARFTDWLVARDRRRQQAGRAA